MARPLKLAETPNFKDPRNKQRAMKVLAWAEDKLTGAKRGKSVSSGEIREVFGNKDRPGPSRWLFANLMLETEGYQLKKRYTRYRLKRSGLLKVYRALDQEAPAEVEVLRRKYAEVLTGAPLEYRDSGTRRYHEIQNIKRDLRKALFEGWWDYDIEACAPTLIYQYAAAHSREQHGCDLPFPAVARLVRDKAAVRQHVAELTGLTVQPTKELLTMLLFRANTAPFHKNRLFSLLGCDQERLKRFLNDPLISEFRSDVERMWAAVLRRDDGERKTVGQQPAQFKRASKRRMSIYLGLERRVMDAILGRLVADGATPILMHDGFMSRTKADVDELVRAVKDQTGFDVRLSEAHLGSVGSDVEPDAFELMRATPTDDEPAL